MATQITLLQARPVSRTRLMVRVRQMVKRVLFTVFPYAVIAGFFWLQIQIVPADTPAHMVLLGMTVIAEGAILFVWGLFAR